MSDDLTRDNLHLSRPTMVDEGTRFAAGEINFTSASSLTVADYVRESLAENTRTAYLSDLEHFERWGGQIPATPEMIAAYLAAHAAVHTVATLNRRLAALAKVHRSHGFSNPTSVEVVKATLRGLKRIKGTAQRQAVPLVKDDLFIVLEAMGSRLKDLRDRALLLVGFAGGFRRSELVGLNCEDLVLVRHGLEIALRRSKTDQNGAGRKVGVPHGRGRWCPVVALEQWRVASGVTEGAIFRPVDRHDRVGQQRLSAEAVCLVVRERVQAAGIEPKDYSGHSLRAGLATSAAQAGVSPWKIRQQTGHASDAMLGRYIRDGELFIGNAAGALL
ncbi:site-specific integrase [Bradyrhizobium neotropicale]|uniref:Integrase n=1 Tax=Bradyrhizobium neotropicale TaxID=1497615 RepID=A0A176ZC94_9BRAD|nr:tyrosine-type recombinase/integrase [Bradyrhizobium neotropicale]OAF17406.1 integrase [Bradyrhizobium neotropicale]